MSPTSRPGIPEKLRMCEALLAGGLGAQMRALRQAAGMTGGELAGKAGTSQATVSRIERELMCPSVELLGCLLDALGATARERERVRVRHQAMQDGTLLAEDGSAVAQRYAVGALVERSARRSRWFSPLVLPDLLQVAGYLRITVAGEPWCAELDPAAVAVRHLDRQEILFDTGHEFTFVIDESVIHDRRIPPSIMRAQLHTLRSLDTLPNITLGIIPAHTPRPRIPWAGFAVFDDTAVSVADFTGAGLSDAPDLVAAHIGAFDQFAAIAVYQHRAHALLDAADTLTSGSDSAGPEGALGR